MQVYLFGTVTILCSLLQLHVPEAQEELGQAAARLEYGYCLNLAKMLQGGEHHVGKLHKLSARRFISPAKIFLPANRSKGGAYDIVCCAVVGLTFPGLEAEQKT